MLLITTNRSKKLLLVSFVGDVRPAEIAVSRPEITSEMAGLKPGFYYLVDFTNLLSMSVECAPEMGLTMELLGRAGVGMVVRVIPDPSKDIGLNILTVFHYPHQLPVVTCQNLAEALNALGL